MQIIPMRELKNTVEIDAFTKLEFEAQFQHLSPGGAISYVEVPDMQNNIPAVLVMDIEYYERTMKEMEEAKLIMEGLRDVDEGRVVDGPTALEEIRREYGL